MLFLSWDANTRSIFYQFLVFKLLRVSRKDLQNGEVQNSKVFDQDRMLLTKQEAIVRIIKKQLEGIFDFRKKKVEELFPSTY